jgi:geranylgeranyl diphosphate synthase type II
MMNKYIESYTEKINATLEKYLPENKSDVLDSALRYSVFAGGKRIRPIICLAFCDMISGDTKKSLPFACALEMVHTYSLIFDDLPCMDNDSLRRGIPTNHVVFGESTALLAGMGLFGEAFAQIIEDGSRVGLSDRQIIQGISILLDASGKNGIVRGQVLDLENKPGLTEKEVLNIHNLKTAAMLKASALLGCVAANASEDVFKAAEAYAENIGLAFQIRDDILDVSGSVENMGKTLGKDAADARVRAQRVLHARHENFALVRKGVRLSRRDFSMKRRKVSRAGYSANHASTVAVSSFRR